MKWTESCKWSSCQNAGDQGERERETGENVYFHTSKFAAQSSLPRCVCVHVCKINRPCDEQPVPRWKHILWNTTVLWRKLAKHWLGSIGLRLRCPANNTSLTLPRCHIWMQKHTHTRTHRSARKHVTVWSSCTTPLICLWIKSCILTELSRDVASCGLWLLIEVWVV